MLKTDSIQQVFYAIATDTDLRQIAEGNRLTEIERSAVIDNNDLGKIEKPAAFFIVSGSDGEGVARMKTVHIIFYNDAGSGSDNQRAGKRFPKNTKQ
jgi:hypothetical protein